MLSTLWWHHTVTIDRANNAHRESATGGQDRDNTQARLHMTLVLHTCSMQCVSKAVKLYFMYTESLITAMLPG